MPRKAKEAANPNMIKTSNRLIGEIENKDLYNEDEDLPEANFASHNPE
jgi:hypothetical protein